MKAAANINLTESGQLIQSLKQDKVKISCPINKELFLVLHNILSIQSMSILREDKSFDHLFLNHHGYYEFSATIDIIYNNFQ